MLIRDYVDYALLSLWVKTNPFSRRRRRPPISRCIRYTMDALKHRADCEIGPYTYGIPTVAGHPEARLKVGKFCSIAAGVVIYLGHNHRGDLGTTFPFRAFVDDFPMAAHLKAEDVDAVSKGDVVIGNDVWIAHGALIVSGVNVGDGAIIGAGAVVTRSVEPYGIVAGNPAKLVRKRFDEETIRALLEIKWWDWPVEMINNNIALIYKCDIAAMRRLKKAVDEQVRS